MFLARLNGEGGEIYIEDDAATVATNLERMTDGETLSLEYWNIKDGPNISLQPVTLKSGARASAVAKEVAEIEAGGEVVGAAEVVA